MLLRKKYVEVYRRWLQLMNYVQESIDYGPVRLNDFLEWMNERLLLESKMKYDSTLSERTAEAGLTDINQITGSLVKQYFKELGQRKSKTTGEVLSISTLRNHLTTINRFARYLRQTGEGNIEELKDEIRNWDEIVRSPYSYSFYSSKKKRWNHTPKNCYRISNHWNFTNKKTKRKSIIHCRTNVPVKNFTYWTLAVFEHGIWKVIKSLPNQSKQK